MLLIIDPRNNLELHSVFKTHETFFKTKTRNIYEMKVQENKLPQGMKETRNKTRKEFLKKQETIKQ